MASFFAGVGGIDLGFKETEKVEVVYANEFDPHPAKTYNLNFTIDVDCRDIGVVEPEDVPAVDIMAGGFPCQAFSIAGHRQGFEDSKGRGMLFFELARLVKEKKPQVVFLENVKNLVGHDKGNTFKTIIKTMENLGYHCKYKVLNAMEYGNMPQNRERIYIVAFRDEVTYAKFEFPEVVTLTKSVSDIVDFDGKAPEKYYYTPGKFKGDLYEKLASEMSEKGAVYQWRRKYVRKNQSGVIPTLTANMGEGGHNVPLVLTDDGIRKLTPRECFLAQGFPRDFKLPADEVDSRLYKEAGNSVCVEVVHRIAEKIVEALDSTK